jgi:plasmid stability protein
MGRTTITLEDDLLRRLKAEARRTGRSFKDVVNTTVRQGLAGESAAKPAPFSMHGARDLGGYPGLDYDNIAKLIEFAEGPGHR